MKISNIGIELIKKFEGYRSDAYLCPSKVWTIGWGTTIINGVKVKEGDRITIEKANEALLADLKKFEAIVNSRIKINLTQNKFDALVSHTYNTGGSDKLFDLINQNGNGLEVRDWWEDSYITSNGIRLNGLINRRLEEVKLFFY